MCAYKYTDVFAYIYAEKANGIWPTSKAARAAKLGK